MTRDVYQPARSETLLEVTLVVATTFTANTSNYWTIQLRRLRPGQSFGEDVGAAFSLATFTLTADEPATIYSDAAGTELENGDRLVVEMTKTGTPAQLQAATFNSKIQGR